MTCSSTRHGRTYLPPGNSHAPYHEPQRDMLGTTMVFLHAIHIPFSRWLSETSEHDWMSLSPLTRRCITFMGTTPSQALATPIVLAQGCSTQLHSMTAGGCRHFVC